MCNKSFNHFQNQTDIIFSKISICESLGDFGRIMFNLNGVVWSSERAWFEAIDIARS